MSRLLLDTHVVLWWLTGSRLETGAEEAIADPANTVLLSLASVWEVSTKQALGKLELPEDVADAAVAEGLTLLGIEVTHLRVVGRLPQHHRDPFDRLPVAQAQVEQAVLVTRDARLSDYDVRTLAA